MFGPHNPRARLRALTAAACTADLGATLLGTAGAFPLRPKLPRLAPA
ncbi:hypothetical protein ACFRFL_41385 [Streptomyces sp. NPDC056708]